MDTTPLPPNAAEAESALIAIVLQIPSALDDVADLVTTRDFYRLDTRRCFEAISHLAEKGHPFDVVALADALDTAGTLADVGGLPGLGRLAASAGSAENIAHYAGMIASKARSRALMAAASRTLASARTEPPEAVSAALGASIDAIMAGRDPGGFRAARDALREAFEGIEARWQGRPRRTVATGLSDLDHALGGGLEPGQLAILAARPSMGKSALAAQAAAHAAKVAGPVAYFSLEMNGAAIMERLMSARTGISYSRLRVNTSRMEDHEWPKLSAAAAHLAQLPLHLSDRPGLTMTRLRADCRRLKREAGSLALVVVDYLGLMESEGRHDNRVNEVSALTRGLKLAAMELDAPILALAQLNRGLESRPNKRPMLADLRESGSIEQDADVVAFIYRDEVYNENSKAKGQAEIIIGKQRNGPCGSIPVAWRGASVSFADLAPAWEERPF